MTNNVHDGGLDALKAEIERLRNQISASFAELKAVTGQLRSAADTKGAGKSTDAEGDTACSSDEAGSGDVHERFDTVRSAASRALNGLIEETTHHPLTGILVAFGLGYITARLFTGGGKK